MKLNSKLLLKVGDQHFVICVLKTSIDIMNSVQRAH
jgi:hypothetical protein